jgi:phenylalanine-4-hydroxylase
MEINLPLSDTTIPNTSIINPDIRMFNINAKNQEGNHSLILNKLRQLDVEITKSDYTQNEKDLDMYQIELFLRQNEENSPITEDILTQTLEDLVYNVKEMDALELPYFPTRLEEIDQVEISLIEYAEDGANKDHPGFTDMEYVNRRNQIGNLSVGYKMGQPIPRVEYTQVEKQLWETMYNLLQPAIMEHTCEKFRRNFQELMDRNIFQPGEVPQLEDINQVLMSKCNWRIKPVHGIVDQRIFLNLLAFRTFCSTQFLRHHSKPLYSIEPDICHEFFGHISMFLDKEFCDISQRLGLLSLGASDAELKRIAAIYWYTVEFGLIREQNKMKVYGGGIVSSITEIEHSVTTENVYPLNVHELEVPSEFIIDDLQPLFYYIDR